MDTENNLTTGMQRLADLSRKMDEIRAQMKAEGESAFNAACAEVFAAHPKLESFSWTQYTPYFNDGDPCEFGTHTDYPTMTFDGVELHGCEVCDYEYTNGKRLTVEPHITADEIGDGDEDEDLPEGFDHTAAIAARNAIDPILDFIGSNDSVAQDAFGDHCRVIVTRDGVETDEYDHD